MSGFLNDLSFGLRQLAVRPGFAIAAILTLALGIGANTAVFSVLNGYLLKPLPYPHVERLTTVRVRVPKMMGNVDVPGSIPLYLALKENVSSFSSVAAIKSAQFNLQVGGRSEVINGARVTGSLFRVLGIEPLLGTAFTEANDQPGRGQIVVLSHDLWERLFGGSRNVIGQTIKLDGKPYHVAAVMPPQFALHADTDLWVPLTISASDRDATPSIGTVFEVGKLGPGANWQALQQQLKLAQAHMINLLPPMMKRSGYQLYAVNVHRSIERKSKVALLLLQAAVLLVLLIACINVANLLLSRILGRAHEMAMRSALGAGRLVLARQLLVEAACLAVPGGVLGIALGWLCLRLVAVAPFIVGGSLDVSLDWRVGLFAFGVICATGGLVSMLPIFHLSRADIHSLLQGDGHSRNSGLGARRARNALVIAELTLAAALLAGAGLLLHSFIDLENVNTGFNVSNLLTAHLRVPNEGGRFHSPLSRQDTERLASTDADLLHRVKAVPGVEYAATSAWLPFDGFMRGTFIVRNQKTSAHPPFWTQMNFVSDDYFNALGVPLLQGRYFNSTDERDSRRVAIVGKRFADKFFDGQAIGKEFVTNSTDPNEAKWIRIVGVVPPVKSRDLGSRKMHWQIYLPAASLPATQTRLILRTSIPPRLVVKELRKILANVNPGAAIYHVRTERELLAASLSGRRSVMILVAVFGGMALALAVVGLYGVMSYAVGQRRAECGVRLALGALPEDLLWLILKDGFRLLAVGLVLGLALAVLLGYVISARLFGVAPFDPVTLAGTAVVLALITLAACWLPARRAAKVDPAIAMMEQ